MCWINPWVHVLYSGKFVGENFASKNFCELLKLETPLNFCRENVQKSLQFAKLPQKLSALW